VKVYVRFYGELERIMSARELQLTAPDNTSLDDILALIEETTGKKLRDMVFNERGEFRGSYVILVNGEVARNLNIKLSDEASIAFVPTAVGGRKKLVCCKNTGS